MVDGAEEVFLFTIHHPPPTIHFLRTGFAGLAEFASPRTTMIFPAKANACADHRRRADI
ncbi:MAG TPA: hypothetical protein VEL76_43550 [Gemmataceae bacterium]|nr:hypothetical protein [Gemmataceae bacterium]